MKFENTQVWGFEHAFRGMRNPKNSWSLSDSNFRNPSNPILGPKDLKLAQSLIRGGSEHRKFLRQIFVSVDITAPLYWFKEADTYKVGTVANSCSTMHTIHTRPITLDCFETDDYHEELKAIDDAPLCGWIEPLIGGLERLRQLYLQYKDTDKRLAKQYWKELIRWLPESWLQTRTVTMSYENIYSMVRQRGNHKLNEWSGKDDPALKNFISWARSLPLAEELIFLEERTQKRHTKIICISGHARAGKDTSAAMMREELEREGYRVLVTHYADLLKFVCQSLFEWDGQKDEAGRYLLQYIGTDVVRKREPDFWVNYVIEMLKLFPNTWDYVLIPDARFPNEVEKLKEAGFDVTHVRISRSCENNLTERQKAHLSETALNDIVPDVTIENNGSIDDLKQNIAKMVSGKGFIMEIAVAENSGKSALGEATLC